MTRQVGTVEILNADRVYPLDPDMSRGERRTEAIVEVGTVCPLYLVSGHSYLWVMTGVLNLGAPRRMGDGMFIISSSDQKSGIEVKFPSYTFGPDEFADFLVSPVATEGHEEQRLRFDLWEEGKKT